MADKDERKALLKEVDRRLVKAHIAGCAEVKTLYFDAYTAITESEYPIDPVQFSSFDTFTIWRAISCIDDPNKIRELIKAHQSDLGDLASGAFDIERKECTLSNEERMLPLKVQEVCSENLRNYLRGLRDAMRSKDLSLDIEEEWINDGASLSGHVKRVGMYALAIGRYLGLNQTELKYLKDGGEFHDIGKTRVNDKILEKKGSLNDQEWESMKKHPAHGVDILFHITRKVKGSEKDVEYLKRITEAAAFHHERYDGRGYPYGAQRDCFPRDARIISLADAFDAMASGRPHSKPKCLDYMRREILEKGKGTQFDPELCEKGVFDTLVSTHERIKKAA